MKHEAFARPRPIWWSVSEPRTIKASGHDWEVVCESCGDDLGPVEIQPAHVQLLRGPYETLGEAAHAARQHQLDVRRPVAAAPAVTCPA